MTPAEKVLFERVADKSDQYVAERKRNREMTEHLRNLTDVVSSCLVALDQEMAKPSSPERGSRIARICNALNIQNDMAKRFGLGIRK